MSEMDPSEVAASQELFTPEELFELRQADQEVELEFAKATDFNTKAKQENRSSFLDERSELDVPLPEFDDAPDEELVKIEAELQSRGEDEEDDLPEDDSDEIDEDEEEEIDEDEEEEIDEIDNDDDDEYDDDDDYLDVDDD